MFDNMVLSFGMRSTFIIKKREVQSHINKTLKTNDIIIKILHNHKNNKQKDKKRNEKRGYTWDFVPKGYAHKPLGSFRFNLWVPSWDLFIFLQIQLLFLLGPSEISLNLWTSSHVALSKVGCYSNCYQQLDLFGSCNCWTENGGFSIMTIKGWINIIHPQIRLICNLMRPLMIDFEGIRGHMSLN